MKDCELLSEAIETKPDYRIYSSRLNHSMVSFIVSWRGRL
jgi:hypothetical protein